MRHDRPAVSHEYVFLLSPSERYYAVNPGEKWWGHSVWEIRSEAQPGFPAPMPIELARRCVLAGSREGDLVLDPFNGCGRTGQAAVANERRYVGIELNPDSASMAQGLLEAA